MIRSAMRAAAAALRDTAGRMMAASFFKLCTTALEQEINRRMSDRLERLREAIDEIPEGAEFHGGPLHGASQYNVAKAALLYMGGKPSSLDEIVPPKSERPAPEGR